MTLNPKLSDWHERVVWIVGASSGIGRATAAALHARGAEVVVSARNADALQRFVDEHPGSRAIALDVSDALALQQGLARVIESSGGVDLVLYCAGHYKAMSAANFDLAEALQHLQVNYIGALNLLAAVLPQLRAQRSGHLSMVASVAGYRGLPKALAYGPTKAALQLLADTLYLDLHAEGIGVSVINPGFVETPLTAGNRFTMPALLTPVQAANFMLDGWARGRFEIHFPKRFSLWLKLLRLLPDSWYFAMVRRATGA